MPTLISFQEFATSTYADMADQVDNIESVINQAEAHIQRRLDREFAEVEYVELHRVKQDVIFLRERPIISIDEINRRATYLSSWEALDVNTFRVDSDTGVLTALAENVSGYEVSVAYTAGYAQVPADIKAATIFQTVLLAYQDFEVFGAGDGKEPAIKHLQQQIDMLLKPYVKTAIF